MTEWSLLQTLSHPFIVKAYLLIQEADSSYLLLDQVQGSDLFRLKIQRKLKIHEISFIVSEVVVALEYLHSKSIIYRDLKPENVMIDLDGHAKLIDFDLSKRIDSSKTYTSCGSPEYMAPEMFFKKGYSFEVDWWALGILIYELLCG